MIDGKDASVLWVTSVQKEKIGCIVCQNDLLCGACMGEVPVIVRSG